jgi:hypothetical protein
MVLRCRSHGIAALLLLHGLCPVLYTARSTLLRTLSIRLSTTRCTRVWSLNLLSCARLQNLSFKPLPNLYQYYHELGSSNSSLAGCKNLYRLLKACTRLHRASLSASVGRVVFFVYGFSISRHELPFVIKVHYWMLA